MSVGTSRGRLFRAAARAALALQVWTGIPELAVAQAPMPSLTAAPTATVSEAPPEAESSGDYLIEGEIAPGSLVGLAEVSAVEGRGPVPQVEPPTPEEPKKCDCSGSSCPRMAVYGMSLLNIGLTVSDHPVGYRPARGPDVEFTVTYNQNDVFQPQTFSYVNLGPKWTFDWLAYIEEDSQDPNQVKHYARGGGQSTYTLFVPNPRNQAVVEVARAFTTYTRYLPDGSHEVYSAATGTSPRKYFMTAWGDRNGNALHFAYDTSLRLVSVTDATGLVTTLTYGLASDPLKITRVTDPYGRFATFEYDSNGRLSTITDVIGIASSFVYDGDGLMTSMTTPYGTSRFATGGEGTTRWLEATDAAGGKERLEFNQSNTPPIGGEPAGMPNGINTSSRQFRNTYYWSKRAMASYPGDNDPGRFASAHVYHWLHGPAGSPLSGTAVPVLESEKAPLENRVYYNYPGQASPIYEGTSSKPIAVGRLLDNGTSQIHRYEHNAKGFVTKSTDPKGRQTSYCYDANGIDLKEVRQTTGRPSTDPSPCGGTAGTAGINDLTQSFGAYTEGHQPLSITDAAGQTTTYTYNSFGQVLTVTTPQRAGYPTEQRTTTYAYDSDGHLSTVTAPFPGAVTTYTYDGYGRVRTVTSPDGYTITTDYDSADRPVRATFPDGTYEETTYDRLDVSGRRDRLGRWTRMGHDALRRLTWTRDPLDRTITQIWCACGSLEKLLDASTPPNATTWTYDLQGRVTEQLRQNGTKTTYTYENAKGRLKTKTNARSQVTTYTYDTDDNLLTMTHTGPGTGTHTGTTLALTYQSNYNRLSTRDVGFGPNTTEYYPVGQLGALQPSTVDGTFASDTVTYTYDELGRTRTRAMNGSTTTWDYDELGRVKSVSDGLGVSTHGYDGATQRVLSTAYPNGQSTTYSYQPLPQDPQLADLHNKRPNATTLSRFLYSYDTVGNIRTWSMQSDASAARVWSLGYDAADQLTTARLQAPDGLPTADAYAYAYDPAGNRTTEQLDAQATVSTYDRMNRLTSRASGGPLLLRGTLNEPGTVLIDGRPATSVSTTAPYSFEGMTSPNGSNQSQVQTSDASNQARTNTYQLPAPGAATTFTYDADGNMTADGARTYEWDVLSRLRAVNQGTHRSEFTHDASRLTQVVEKENGVTQSSTYFVWCGDERCEERSADGATVTKRFFGAGVLEGASKYYYARDHLGTVREMTDQSGAVRARYEYDPYGRQTKLSGDKDALFAFTGQQSHAPSGLYYYRARYYDPKIGRFASEDPIRLRGGINLFRYVRNNPARWRDPKGLFPGTGRMRGLPCRIVTPHLPPPCVPNGEDEIPDRDRCRCITCPTYPPRCPTPDNACRERDWDQCVPGFGGPYTCFTGEPNPEYPGDDAQAQRPSGDPDAPDINQELKADPPPTATEAPPPD